MELHSEYPEQGLEDLEVGLEISEVCPEISDGVPTTEGDVLDSCCDGFQKKMLPNTQSIEGL